MALFYKYYIGSRGPQLYRSKNGELPFRVELAGHAEQGAVRDVALNFGSGVVGSGPNIEGTITGTDYSVFRAIHFNAFNIAGDLL